jgi:hypothetical protein
MLSSFNNTVSNLYPQGVTRASRKRERSQSHVESIHPQGVATTSLERERSQSHVDSSYPQGVARTSLERERSQSHVETLHPQGAAPTSLERDSSKSHVESQARSAAGSSDALVLVLRRRPMASCGRTYALSAEANQASKWQGEAWEASAQVAGGPELRGWCGIPDGGCSHPAQPASVQAHVGSSLVSIRGGSGLEGPGDSTAGL